MPVVQQCLFILHFGTFLYFIIKNGRFKTYLRLYKCTHLLFICSRLITYFSEFKLKERCKFINTRIVGIVVKTIFFSVQDGSHHKIIKRKNGK